MSDENEDLKAIRTTAHQNVALAAKLIADGKQDVKNAQAHEAGRKVTNGRMDDNNIEGRQTKGTQS